MGGIGWMGGRMRSRLGAGGWRDVFARPAFPAVPALPAFLALPALPALLIAIAVVATACNPKPPETKDYTAKIAAERATKDTMFQNGNDPVPTAKHAEFLPLAYFPIDP